RVHQTWGSQRLLSFLFSIFAGLALVLATIGLYGLLAYTTLKRVREIGIRLALGARPAQIRVLVLSHGMHLLLIGSVIGLFSAFALSRALQRSEEHTSELQSHLNLVYRLLLETKSNSRSSQRRW